MEKKIVSLQVNDNIDETTKSVVSLKTQLRLAQQEVAELSEKFGATSKEAVEAAKKAAILKDTIGDAKNLTDAFNPDAKFKALSSSLSGVASGFAAYQGALGLAGVESKDLEKQLLKVQSAMAIAEGLQGLGEARDSLKQLKAVGVNAFNAIKTAIGGTGIGLIVVAAGAIYAYWDDIKEAVSSVSAEQKNLNAISKQNLDTEQKKLDTIGSQDNILKLQGKSEKEILKIKLAQTDQVIKASEIQIEQSIATSKAQTEAAKRNQEILAGVLKFISIPLTLLLKTVDSIGLALGKNFGLEDKVFGGLSSLIFDPVKIKKDGDAVVEEQRKALAKLKNDRAGLQLAINSIDKQTSENSKSERVKNDTSQKEAEEKRIQERKDYIAKGISEEDEIQAAKDALILKQEEDKKNKGLKELADNAAMQKKKTDDEKDNVAARVLLTNIEKEEKLKAAEATAATLSGLSDLLGKETAAGKAAAVASATISTFLSAQKAYESTVGIPYVGPILAPINAGIAIAAGLKSVKSILSVKTPKGGSSGSAPAINGPSGGAANATAAAPSFNVVGTSGQNQIAQSIGSQAPVKAYVVSGDVTTAQSLDRNIVSTATLGN